MVNMKILLLVSLAIVIAEAVPVRDHKLAKRSILQTLESWAGRVKGHLEQTVERIQGHIQQTRETINQHHDNLREQAGQHFERVRSDLTDFAENARNRLSSLTDDSGEDSSVDDDVGVDLA